MLLKYFYPKNFKSINKLINKKLLNNKLYEKAYLKHSLSTFENIVFADNNNKYLEAKIKNYTNGISFLGNLYNYKIKFNKTFNFKAYETNFIKYTNLLTGFYFSLTSLNSTNFIKKNKTNTLILLKPVKGGFICYSLGIIGFLPRSHLLFIFKTNIQYNSSSRLINKKLSLNSEDFRFNNAFNNKYYFMRLHFIIGKMNIHLKMKKKLFSKTSKKKVNRSFTSYNFVFLQNKYKEKNKRFKLKNEKFKKKIKSLFIKKLL